MTPEPGDHFDAAIERAARQIVEHDPPQRMYSAVRGRVAATTRPRRQNMLRWPAIAVPVAAALALAIVLWKAPGHDVQQTTPRSERSTAGEPAPAVTEREAVRVPLAEPRRARHGGGAGAIARPVTWPGEPPAPIEVEAIQVNHVRVPTIAADSVAIPAIHISEINIERR
jgi:hypothetical protein